MVYCNKECQVNLDTIFDAVKQEVGVDNKHLIVNLSIVSQEEIHDLNKKFREVDRPTDVLSFPLLEGDFSNENNIFDVDPQTNELCLGDIYICDEIVAMQAKEYGHSYKREFAYLFVHGLLHLFGFDHMNDEDKRIMRDKEEQIMAKLNITRDGE